MPSLADRPEIIGFFSYSRDDDRDSEGSLSVLRRRIQNELRGLLGRSESTLRLFQDAEAIPSGTFWEKEIGTAINQSVFFVPIVTPRVVRSEHCKEEFQKFLERERTLGRDDLMFPIVYIEVGELRDERAWRAHPVLKHIGARQYVDWCDYRFEPDSPVFRRAVASFARTIAMSLRRDIGSPGKTEIALDSAEARHKGQAVSAASARLGEEGAVSTREGEPPAPARAVESDPERRSRSSANAPDASGFGQHAGGVDTQAHPMPKSELANKGPSRDREQRPAPDAPAGLLDPDGKVTPSSASTLPSLNRKNWFFRIFNLPPIITFSISMIEAAIFCIYLVYAGSPADKKIFLSLFVIQVIMYILIYILLRSYSQRCGLLYLSYALISIPPSIFFTYITCSRLQEGRLDFDSTLSLLISGSLVYGYCGLWGIVSALHQPSIKN